MSCQHTAFDCNAKVGCLTDIQHWMLEIRVTCSQCGQPFQFPGLQPGVDLQGARITLDGLEARLAIAPEGTTPDPRRRISFDISASDLFLKRSCS